MDHHRKSRSSRNGSVAAVAGSAAATGRSLLDLVDSELTLTGSALLRAALVAMIAIALAGVGGLLLAGLFVLLLQAAGLGWLLSLSMVTAATLVACIIAIRRARDLLDLCGLPATRRQLSRLIKQASTQPEPRP